MRRFLRWAWNGLAAASLLLCVATCVLWARSYRVADVVSMETRPSPPSQVEWYVRSIRGVLYLARNDHATAEAAPRPLGWDARPPAVPESRRPRRPGRPLSLPARADRLRLRRRAGALAHRGDGPALAPRRGRGRPADGVAPPLIPPAAPRLDRALPRVRLRPAGFAGAVPGVRGGASGGGMSHVVLRQCLTRKRVAAGRLTSGR